MSSKFARILLAARCAGKNILGESPEECECPVCATIWMFTGYFVLALIVCGVLMYVTNRGVNTEAAILIGFISVPLFCFWVISRVFALKG